MAKIKVHPRPGALQELLKKKWMTQMDAADGSDRIDRKTLRKIDRGEEVKLETLQKLAEKLSVPLSFFFEATPDGDEIDGPSDSMHTVMLRQLNAQRFIELFNGVDRVEWLPNVRVVDEKVRKVLQDLQDVATAGGDLGRPSLIDFSSWCRAADRLLKVMEELNQRRLALLGAKYLFWACSSERQGPPDAPYAVLRYKSSRTALFSVEPSGTQSRRVGVSPGEEPGSHAPLPDNTLMFVDGPRCLDTGELDGEFHELTHRGLILRMKYE